MKPIHYFSIFVIGFVGGWGIGGWIEKKNSSSMYEYPSVCEVLGKNHPECK
jgi:hypothetical protein